MLSLHGDQAFYPVVEAIEVAAGGGRQNAVNLGERRKERKRFIYNITFNKIKIIN